MKIRILIVEDDVLVATSMKMMLLSFGYSVTGIANTASKALEMFKSDIPDLILCDINLRTKRSGIDFVSKSQKIAFVPVIYVTAYSDQQTVQKAIATAPESYLIKPFSKVQLRTSVALALKKNKDNIGNHSLLRKGFSFPTERELDVLKLLNEGLASREISEKLNISVHTVQTHRKNLMAKCKVNNVVDLIAFAQKHKLIR
jgi:DNA-binding NarL/FixJ family response regulator